MVFDSGVVGIVQAEVTAAPSIANAIFPCIFQILLLYPLAMDSPKDHTWRSEARTLLSFTSTLRRKTPYFLLSRPSLLSISRAGLLLMRLKYA